MRPGRGGGSVPGDPGSAPRTIGRPGDRQAAKRFVPHAVGDGPPRSRYGARPPGCRLSLAVFAALARLSALLGLGWAFRRWRGTGAEVADALTFVVTEATMPALIVATLVQRPLAPALAGAVIASQAGLVAAFAAAWALAPLLTPPGPTRGTFVLVATFCNTGFLGIPVALALWGPGSEGLVTAVMVDSFTTTLLLNSVGVLVARHHAGGGVLDRGALLRLLRTPMFLAAVLGLGLQLAGISLPPALVGLLAEVGGATTVLVFLATGMRLRLGAIPGAIRALGGIAAIRFLVSPLVALLVARALGQTGEVGRQAVLEVATPTALMAPVIAARYGGPSELGPAAVAATTLLTPLGIVAWLALCDLAGL